MKASLARASAGPTRPAWTAHNASGFRARMLAVLQHLHAVDEHVAHAGRELFGFLERRMVLDRRRIEHHHIAIVAGPEEPTLPNAEVGRGQRAQPADRFRQSRDTVL